MNNPAEHNAAGGGMDHGFEDLDSLPVFANQALPSGHSSEDMFDGAALRRRFETGSLIEALYDLRHGVAIDGSIHMTGTIIGNYRKPRGRTQPTYART
jgi:hypothetical protein